MERELDLIVWGATGFTGSLATSYLLGDASKFFSFHLKRAAAPSDLRWAVAGRNREKLETLVVNATSDNNMAAPAPKIIICDANDEVAASAMVSRTRVVVGFAGPFVKYSDLVVAACARVGTHWIDICGEVAWHRSLLDRFNDRARATGAVIVSHCGFDSIPSDLGALFATNALRSRTGKNKLPIRRIINYQLGLGGISGGSLATGMANITNPVKLSEGVDPESPFLLGGEPAGGVRHEDMPDTEAYFDEILGCWIGPFGMADINLKVVRRSNALLGYGPDLGVREVMVCFSEKQARKAARLATHPTPIDVIEKLVKAGRLPAPGKGPSPEKRAKSKFQSTIIAEGIMEPKNNKQKADKVCIQINGGECGYEETAKMAIEAGLALVYEGATCPGVVSGGGFLTPAAALGIVLIHRLNQAGISFKVLPGAAVPAAQNAIRALLSIKDQTAKL